MARSRQKKRQNRQLNRTRKRKPKVIQDNRAPIVPIMNHFNAPILSPDRVMVKLRFGYKLAVSGTGTQQYSFSGNSIYDPDPLVGGTSAEGFAQWMAFYDYYRVHHSKIELDVFADYTAATPMEAVVTTYVIPTQSSSYSLTSDSTNASRYVKKCHVAWTGGGYDSVSNSMDTARLIGLRTITNDMYTLSGTSSSNPTVQWYWQCLFRPMNTLATKLQVDVRVTYTVELFQRKAAIAQAITETHVEDGKVILTLSKNDVEPFNRLSEPLDEEDEKGNSSPSSIDPPFNNILQRLNSLGHVRHLG